MKTPNINKKNNSLLRASLPVLLFLFSLSNSSSQIYNFEKYSIENKLPQNYGIAMAEDPKGFIWIGTADGLLKLGGNYSEVYTRKNGLATNFISTLNIIDSVLFIGHQSGEISCLNINNGQIESTIKHPDIITRINSIIKRNKSELLIATNENGLWSLNIFNNSLKKIKLKNSIKNISSLLLDSNRNIILGSFGGLFVYSSDFTKIFYSDLTLSVFGLIKSKDNYVVATTNSLLRLKTIEEKMFLNLIFIPDYNTITSILETQKGEIIAGANNGDIYIVSLKTNKHKKTLSEKNGLLGSQILSLLEDKEGNIWIGSLNGVCKINAAQQKFELHNFSTIKNVLKNSWSVIQTADKKIWTCTDNGLIEISENSNAPVSYKHYYDLKEFKQTTLMASAIDKNGKLWVGGNNGTLSYFNSTKNKFEKVGSFTKTISTICVTAENNLVIGSWGGGAFLFNTLTNKVDTLNSKYGIDNLMVNKVFIDSKKNTWIGTQGGLLKIDGKGYTRFNRTTNLEHDNINSICEDKVGNIWIGTQSGGIYKYNGHKFISFTTADGLTSDDAYFVLCDKNNNIWIGSSKGVDKYDQVANTFKHYGKAEGFMGIETNLNAAYEDSEGHLWFGTVNGVMKYYPEKDVPNPYEPRTYITDVTLGDSTKTTQTEFSYSQNNITFNYIGISLTDPKKVLYQWKLEGSENENWSMPTKDIKKTFDYLAPGEYTFLVKACNADGIWNKEPAKFHFIITPPFYKRSWFLLLVATCIGISIFLFIRYRTYRLQKKSEILEKQVKERTTEVVEQKKVIEQKNKDITDSISYAKKIQEAILPLTYDIGRAYKDFFIYYRPKDIVSGDFYWFTKKENFSFIAMVDCTGHGVPGAFVSMVGNSSLNQIVNEKKIYEPSQMLKELDNLVTSTLKQSVLTSETRDGMDIALCRINHITNELTFAGANRPLYYLKNNELIKIKGNSNAIGGFYDESKAFTSHTIQINKNDSFYLFSDGYADQFGGPKDKKFMTKNLEKLLLSIQHLPMKEQEFAVKTELESWQGANEAVDDVLVMGIKVI
ncbi:MAG: SpoIIE family protein phosphatase [Bacteroidetes bacterium]|nr:SpoIIE family protein phosphatase [Bacteroidota bacterium]